MLDVVFEEHESGSPFIRFILEADGCIERSELLLGFDFGSFSHPPFERFKRSLNSTYSLNLIEESMRIAALFGESDLSVTHLPDARLSFLEKSGRRITHKTRLIAKGLAELISGMCRETYQALEGIELQEIVFPLSLSPKYLYAIRAMSLQKYDNDPERSCVAYEQFELFYKHMVGKYSPLKEEPTYPREINLLNEYITGRVSYNQEVADAMETLYSCLGMPDYLLQEIFGQ